MNPYVRRIFVTTAILFMFYVVIVLKLVELIVDMGSARTFRMNKDIIELGKVYISIFIIWLSIQLLSWGNVSKKHRNVIVLVQGLLLLAVAAQVVAYDLMKLIVGASSKTSEYIVFINSIDILIFLAIFGIFMLFINFGLGLYYWLNDIDLVEVHDKKTMTFPLVYLGICVAFIGLGGVMSKAIDPLSSIVFKRTIEVTYEANEQQLKVFGYNGYGYLYDPQQYFENKIDLRLNTKRFGIFKQIEDNFLDTVKEFRLSIQILDGINGSFKNGDVVEYKVYLKSVNLTSDLKYAIKFNGKTLDKIVTKGLLEYPYTDEAIKQLSETIVKDGAQKYAETVYAPRPEQFSSDITTGVSLQSIEIMDVFSDELRQNAESKMHGYSLQSFPLTHYNEECPLCYTLAGDSIEYRYNIERQDGTVDSRIIGFNVNEQSVFKLNQLFETKDFEKLEGSRLFYLEY